MGASEPAEVRNGCVAERRAPAQRNANADCRVPTLARCGCNGAVVKEGRVKPPPSVSQAVVI